jgi:hypothetical protein
VGGGRPWHRARAPSFFLLRLSFVQTKTPQHTALATR